MIRRKLEELKLKRRKKMKFKFNSIKIKIKGRKRRRRRISNIFSFFFPPSSLLRFFC